MFRVVILHIPLPWKPEISVVHPNQLVLNSRRDFNPTPRLKNEIEYTISDYGKRTSTSRKFSSETSQSRFPTRRESMTPEREIRLCLTVFQDCKRKHGVSQNHCKRWRWKTIIFIDFSRMIKPPPNFKGCLKATRFCRTVTLEFIF